MANSTLRLDDIEEEKLEEIMKYYGEATKSKAISKVIDKHMWLRSELDRYMKESRETYRELQILKEAVGQRYQLDLKIKELLN